MKRHLLTAFAAFLYVNPAIAKQEPLRLKPSGNWQLAYEKDSCLLARGFGEGDDSVTIMMERFKPGDSFALSAIGKPLDVAAKSPIFVTFGPQGDRREVHYFPARNAAGIPSIVFRGEMRISPGKYGTLAGALDYATGNLPEAEAREKATTELAIDGATRRDVVLELGSLEEPFKAMRLCMAEMVKRWGFDLDAQRSLSNGPRPKSSPGTWLRAGDLPPSAWTGGKQAIVNFRLNVDEEGRPSACHIQRSLGSEAIDRAVCDTLMKRAEFEPAPDAQGKSARSWFIMAAVFQQPARTPGP